MLTGVITALFITSPTQATQGTPQSYLQGCLYQISGVPTEPWYQTPTMGATTYKVKSDLYQTTDQTSSFSNLIVNNNKYLQEYYDNVYKQLQGWSEWYAQTIDYTKQTENFFYFTPVDKFAGLTLQTNKQDKHSEWHGFESNDATVIKKFTTARQKATLPRNIRKISFVYEREEFKLKPNYDKIVYDPDRTSCNGKYAAGGQVLVYYDDAKTSGFIVCLDKYYYRVQSITFEGDGQPLTIGNVKPAEAGVRAVQTYEIPPNHDFLGLDSFYTEITQQSVGEFQSGTFSKVDTQMVGWFNLVTIDRVCAKKLWCPNKPSFYVDAQNSNFEQVVLTWSNVGNTASSTYTIQYGPSYQYSKSVPASAGRVVITENIVSGTMQFRLNTNVQSAECDQDYPVQTYVVQACLPQAPNNVLIQTTGACPATNNQISISWTIPFSNCLPIERFEVHLSNSQYGTYTRYDQLCNGWSNVNSGSMNSCQIPWNSLAQAGLKVGEQIWAIVKTVNRLDSASSQPSGPVSVNDGPLAITQIEAKPIVTDYSIVVKWMNSNLNSFSAGNNPVVQTSSTCTYTLRGRRQGGNFVVIRSGIPARYSLWFEEYTVDKSNTPLGTLECGVTYEFQVQVLCGTSCTSQNDRIYPVVYSFEPGSPTCVYTSQADGDPKSVEIAWKAPASQKVCSTSSLTYQIRIVSSAKIEENANAYCDKLDITSEQKKCVISLDKLKAAPFYLKSGDSVVAKVFSVSGTSQSQVTSSVAGTQKDQCTEQYVIKGCPSEPLEVQVELDGQTKKTDSPTGLTIKWTKPKTTGGTGVSINKYIVWMKNNNGKGEDKLKPILETSIGDNCATKDANMNGGAQTCKIETNFATDDGLTGKNQKLFQKGQTICIYMKAYNDNSGEKCDWVDPANDADKLKYLGQGSSWSLDYSKTENNVVKSNCVTWLECAKYTTQDPINIDIDKDLTNWFEFWIKWDAPTKANNGGADVAYYELIYFKKGEKWSDGNDVKCEDYASLDETKKKEKKLFKLTTSTNKIGIPGLVMKYYYNFCIRACNGVDKCSEDCKLEGPKELQYLPPQLPETPTNFKEIESETCCTYMTVTWNKARDGNTDKNSRDYWAKDPVSTDIESYVISYYLKRDPNLSPQSIVIHKAADIIYDKDQGQCEDKTEAYPAGYSDDKDCTKLDSAKRWPDQKSIDSEKIKNLFQMKYKITQNIIPGETYVVQVSARSKIGPSFATDPLEVMAICCPTAPHSLRTDSSKSTGSNIVLTWEKATSECSPIVSHEILQKEDVKDGGIQWSAQQSLVADNFWTKKNAATCQEYEFAVIAKNKKCRSPVSNLFKLKAAGKPDRPTMKKCSFDAVNQEFTFSWTKANTDTCAPVTDYLLRVRNGFSSYTQVMCPFSTSESCTVKASQLTGTYPLNLKWGDEICPIVSATNRFGASLDSFESSSYCCKYQVEHKCPNIVEVGNGDDNAKASENKDDYATFSFQSVTPQLGGAMSYKVRVKRNGVWNYIDPNPLPTGASTFTVRGMSYDQTYELQVVAFNDAGESTVCTGSSCSCTRSYQHKPTVCPNPPQYLKIESQSSDACTQEPLTLSWTEPISRQGVNDIDGYKVYYKAGQYEYQILPENVEWTQYQDALSKSTTKLTIKLQDPIKPGFTTFYVKAYVGTCLSQASNLKQFEFVTGDVSAPIPVVTSSCGSNTINISWATSLNPQITGYKVMMSTGNGLYYDIGTVLSRNQNSLSVQYDNNKNVLQKGIAYSFKLVVLSSTCSWSEKASQTVSHTLQSPPTQPSSVSLSEVQSGKYCLRWSNYKSQLNSQTKNFRVQYQAGTNGFGQWQNAQCDTILGQNSRECCFTPANQNQVGCASYTARVTALSDCSESQPASATTTQASKPAQPTLSQQCAAQNSQTSIALQWTNSASSCNVITRYIVEYEQANIGWFNVQMMQPQSAAEILNGAETSIVLSGVFKDGQPIKPGFVYNFRISACNTYGCSWSNVIQASTNSIVTASNMPSRIYIQNCGIGFLRVFWKEKYATDPQFKFMVFGKNQQPQEVKCFNYANDYNICLIHTDILRQAPYNLQDGQEFTLQVMAANGFSTGTQFQNSCGGTITNAVVQDTYTLPPRCINVQTCPFQYFDETLLLVKDVPNLLPSTKSAVPQENDVPTQALDDLGLDKNSESTGKQIKSFNIKLENGNSTSDDSSSSDHINLKDSTIENGFTDAAQSDNEETENFGLGIFAGIGMILLIEVILVGGFYIYSKKSQNEKKSVTRAAEQDESHLSSQELNNGTVPAEEEDFSATMKNINGNSIFVDRQTAQQNKIEHEV